jgi:hypothetical protein
MQAATVFDDLGILCTAKIVRAATMLRAVKISGAVMVLRAAKNLREWPRSSPRRRSCAPRSFLV